MFKKIILILTLICMIVIPAYGQTGTYTTHNLFYLPKYGASGITEYNEYNAYMEIADLQIWANKEDIAAIDTSNYYLKTEIDTQGEVEAIWGVSLVNDGDLDLYYLKTAIDTQGEMETIWGVSLLNDITGESIGDLSDVDLTDIANEKILKYNSTSGNWECEDESGGGLTEEQVQDTIGGILDDAEEGNIIITYDDDTPLISGLVDINSVTEAMLNIDNAPVDEYSLTYEADSGKLMYKWMQPYSAYLAQISGMSPIEGSIIVGRALDGHFYQADSVFDSYDNPLLKHEHGGLEADVSAYDGLLKISGGSTSAVTDNSTNWDTAYGWGDHSTLYYLKTEIDTLGEVETIYTADIVDTTELATALGDYYLKTAIDTLGEVETIYSADIVDTTELATALTDYYLKTAIDSLSEVETIWSVDVTDSTELATALTDYYLKTAIDTQGELETIWGVTLLNDITGEDFADLADIPAHPAAATKILETTVDGYAWIDTPSGGGASELSDLSDVGVTTKTDKFVLVADGDSFESRALTEADISDLGVYLEDITGEASTDLTDTADLLYETELDDFSELQTQIGNKTLINEEDEITFDIFPITPSAAPDANYEVANKKYVDDNAGDSKTNWVYPQDYATGTGTEGDPWAGSCLHDAYTACPTGGTIYLRPGYYDLASQLNITKAISIIGGGIQRTFIVTSHLTTHGIYIECDYITLQGFTVDGDSITTVNKACIGVGTGSDYVLLRDIEAFGAPYCINVFEVNHSTFQNIYLHDSGSEGIHPGSDHAGRNMYNTYENFYCWDNATDGFYDRGCGEGEDVQEECHNVYHNIKAWDNAHAGISIEHQKAATISDCHATGNGKYGFTFEDLSDSTITNCIATLNGVTESKSAVLSNACTNLTYTNVIVLNNYTGFQVFQGCDGITLNACQAYDNRETPLQAYGLELDGTASSDISLVNCKLLPNADGKISNSSHSDISGTSVHPLVADHDWNGTFETAPVGENVVLGQLLYRDWGDTEWMLAKADAFGTTPAQRIALQTAANGENCMMLIRGEIWDISAFDFGASRVYLNDDTAGSCDDTAPAESGDQIQLVGIGITADILDFCPSINVGEVK